MKGSQKRHIAKAFTWRIVGTIDTITLTWIFSGISKLAFKVGFTEVVTKMILYYVHERLWFKINLTNRGRILESRKRHIIKSITWRFFGTIDTILLAWVISGNPKMGMKIGLAEVATKMVLYYLHERVWYKTNFGLVNRKRND
jgi:uncharacterized membrane protein